MAEFKYEITQELGVISEGKYIIELNMVSWNDREPKYDIRSWAPDHSRMGKGISLTEEELAVYKRGRNAHSPTMAKHATMADYRRATGFEALMGYLYLKEDYSRIVELVRKGIPEENL